MMPETTLTLGPLLFNWPAERWRDFYAGVADEMPVDRVCLGEVVCSKRLPFIVDEFAGTIERLRAGGKSVILSSLALPTLPRERALIGDLLAVPDVLIEANDVSVLAKLAGRPHVVGPFVNVYNEGTLGFLARNGAVHVCLPPELPLASIRALAPHAGAVALEAWAFGRAPLAISARCYHARLHGLAKDSCQFVCGEDADGLPADTLDGQRFLAVNGVQTLSEACINLVEDLPSLIASGVRAFRLSPHGVDMVTVANSFRDALDGRCEATKAAEQIAAVVPFAFANGFLHGKPGHLHLVAAE
jgi:collagenase-like PrtC family protease